MASLKPKGLFGGIPTILPNPAGVVGIGSDSNSPIQVKPKPVTVTGGHKTVQHWAELAVGAGKSVSPNIPPEILLGLIQVESDGVEGRISSAGAFGLTQFIPSTAAAYGVKPGDPRSQIYGAAHYLHDLGFKKGNEARAIGMYNPLNGKPNVGYANAVLAAARQYRVNGGGGVTVGVNDSVNPSNPLTEGWDALKAFGRVIINPSLLGKLLARAYAFFWKLVWKAIWEVLIAPIWHWVQRATDYYFRDIMSGKSGSGYYYSMAGIVTAAFWSLGYAILWGRAEDPGLAVSARDSMLGRFVRTGQNAVASRNVVSPSKVEENTKNKPNAVTSKVPVAVTRSIKVARRRPVKVAAANESTKEITEDGSENGNAQPVTTTDDATEPS